MLLLRNLTYEDCGMVVGRILGLLDSRYLPMIAGTTIRPVTAFE
jgi:hypothetical protein